MSLNVRPYIEQNAQAWDEFCQGALQATFLHTRSFLSYHGKRFEDCSLVIEDKGKWLGLFPCAVNPNDKLCVVSHPGITYGGIIHQGKLRGERMIEAMIKICQYYNSQNFQSLIYKVIPVFYHYTPSQDDLYALFRLKAQRIRCDLSSTIDLQYRLPISERRQRCLKKASKNGIEIIEGDEYLPMIWSLLEKNLAKKHNAKPVHDLNEIILLAQRFPNNIRCVSGLINGTVVAGVILFVTRMAYHIQYITSNEQGNLFSVLDLIFEYCIKFANSENKRWFDFGISNESSGLILNDNLYRFKTEFGGGGLVHEFYELNLRSLEECL